MGRQARRRNSCRCHTARPSRRLRRRHHLGGDPHLARDNAGPALVFQLLWYPSTLWDASLPSFSENASAPILDRAAVGAFSRWYAGDVDLSDPPPEMAPGRAKNLAGLPPAYIAVAGHDPLRDDGQNAIRHGS
jgi:acetyl esterase/lipase